MSHPVKGFSHVYEYNSGFLSMLEALVNEFDYSPMLVLCLVFGPKPKILGYDYPIGGNKFFQMARKYVFIDFR